MRNLKRAHGLAKTFFSLAACALALLAMAACSDSTDEPPSPTPQSVVSATPPAATSTGADDQPDPGIVVQLDSTSTPYPTATPLATVTPYPTATPYPTPPSIPGSATGPAVSIEIPPKADLKYPEVGSQLNDIVSRVETGEISAEEAASEAPIHRGDSVGVTILLSGNVDGVVRFLENNGGANIRAGEDYIEAYVPVLLLVETSQQPGVLQVRLIQPPGETQGASQVVGNGPAVHGSPSWNQAGYTGRGIKVGVIDVGFWGLDDLLGTELPAVVQARCYTSYSGQHTQNLSDCGNGDTHGTEVSESVMDIAPDVTLYISDPGTRDELADAVDWMMKEGVSVINHSALWSFDGPGDGASPLSISPLNTIDTAVDEGIVWVNAAGNQARGTWFKRNPDFTTVSGEAYKLLRFSGSDTVNAQSYIGGPLELRWEDEWGRAETDLDLLVYKQGTIVPWLGSIDPQSGENGHYPYEYVSGRGPVDILILHYGGPEPDWIQLVGWGQTRLTLNSSGAGSIINPAESANPGMLAVGAAPWGNVNNIEGYSSRGPTPDGRVKPDVVGADCGETASSESAFCGTSQAAPHVAGMAALVRQRFPNYTPAQVVSYLKGNAQQRISSPDPNNTWGHGFLVLPPIPQEPPPPTASAPDSVTITSVTPDTNSLTVFWLLPTDTGGSSSLSFDLRYIRSDASSKADANWTLKRQANVTSQGGRVWHMLTDLTGGTPHDVQVRAVNSAGDGPWSATVTGTPAQATPCATGSAIADRANNSLLVSDCDTLLAVRDTLGGTVTLNWAAGTPITNWDGITVGGTPQRIVVLYLPHQGLSGILPPELGNLTGLMQLTLLDNKLTGPIPSELANLSQLTHIFLGDNQLSSPIPSELGRMTKLQGLELYGNRLTGTIPTELGRLTSMEGLHIDNNQLTGTIPAELGRLSSLRWLTLHDNRLTGEIPAELGRLTNLQQLYLSGNRFSGCVPTGLRGVSETDRTHLLKDIGIPYCDVLLSGLSITFGTLSPQFDAYVTDYRVAARASQITVSLTNRHNATIEYLDGADNALADADGAQAGYQVDAPATTGTTIKIKVTSSDGDANHTYTIQLTGPGALGAPEVHQVTAGTNSLTVSWTAPSSDGGSAIIAYDLRHIRSDATNKGDANWTVAQDAWTGSGSLQYVATGLTGGIQYDVQVRAVNATGDGPWSATAVGTITSTAPGLPTSLTATANGQTQIDLSWNAPASDGGANITGYRIEVSSDGSSWSDLVANTNSTSTSYSHTGLTAGSTRHYRVSAINSVGTGTASNVDNATTAAAGVPSAPVIAGVVGRADALTVSWSAPPSDGGSPITAYDLRHIRSDATNKGDANWTVVQDVWTGSGARSYELADLDGGTQYDVQVRAVNSTGDGPWSSTATGTPTSAETTPGSPANAQYVRVGSTTVVSWDPSTGATHYKLYHSDSRFPRCSLFSSGSTSGCDELAANVTATTYEHTSPDADTNNYWITACNAAGCSEIDSGNPARFVDNRPAAPTSAQYVRVGTTAVVTWDPSAGATHYKVYYDDFFGTSCRLSSGSPSFCELLAGSVAGATYTHTSPDDDSNYYWITACNSAGCSDIDSGNPATLVETTRSATAPGAPTRLTATANGQTRIDLSWTAPSDDGGSNITGYKIEVSTNGATWSDLVANTNSTSTSYSHTSLTAGSTRHYRVSAINSVGTGTPSNSANAITGAATAPDLVVDTPTVDTSAPVAGARFTLNATVRNQGNGSSTFTTLRYYRSTDSTISTGDTEVGTDSVSSLNSSGSGDESVSLTAPLTPGTYYYGACVDAVTGESDTTNNCSVAVTVVVGAAPAPDLVVDTPTVDTSAPVAGASFTLSATVRNQGNGSSTFTTLRYYQSSDSTITTGDTEVGTDSVSSLNSSGSGDESVSLTAPSTPGTYYYGACVVAVTGESDTTNNCSAAVVVVVGAATAPDLVVDTPTVSNSTPFTETSFTLNVTVRNQGTGASASTRLRYYVSTDSTITTSDTFFASDLVGTLSSSSFSDKSIILRAQSTPGAYYYGACVDSVTGESDTTNNCSAAVTVTVRDSALLTAPGAPTGLTATANGQTKIGLSWNAPSSDGGTAITGYRIEVSTNGSTWSDLVVNTRSTGTSYSHTGLMAGSTRYYRVFAHNAVGTSAESNVANATTDTQQDTSACATGGAVPDAANNPGLVADCEALLEARDTLAGTATLNWSANVPIGNWDGITVGGTTQRVTRLELPGRVGTRVTGTIPAELGNLTNLEVLAIYGATTSDDQPIKLTGTIPAELGNLINLQELTLHGHLLTGTIPVELGGLTNLETLNLNFTQLSGAIPTELGDLNNLKTLNLYDNDLTGTIPVALGNLANLESLNLSLNRVSGTIPTRFGNLNKLKVLSLGSNQFSGTIPTQLGNLSNLESLAMGFNRVSGTIPTQLGNLTNLKSLSLRGNQLTGTIPSELGGLTKVTVLLLDRNRLTGTIPPELSGLTMLRQLHLASNMLTGCIPAALREVESNDLAQLGLLDCGSANAPGGSTGLTATANGQTEIDLSWTAPSDDGGADITGYRVEVSTNGSSWSDLVVNTNSTSTSFSHTGLAAGSTRHYRVSAINSAGTGTASDTDSATTDSPPAATAPGAPTGLSATADGQTEIDLSWTAPSDDGGADITGYKIEVSTSGSTWSDLVANTNSTSTSYSHTGLTAGSTRHYRVSAINSAGTGPVSNTDNATTNSAPPPTRPTGVAVTGIITECSAEQVAQGVDSYRITIAGTLDAIRTVKAVRVTGSLSGGAIVGIDLVGDMAAGESASFNIISYLSGIPSGTCEVELEWLEIS